jgi:hypothetical protein
MDLERLATAAPALIFGAAIVVSSVWAIRHAVLGGEHRTRQGIRRLESYANHPGARRLLDDIHHQPREEEL